MSEKIRHTAGPWTSDEHGGSFYVWGPDMAMVADNENEGGFVDAEVVARMRGTGRGATDEEKAANAALIALAPTAPHSCDVPDCPGNENRRRLEEYEALKQRWDISDEEKEDRFVPGAKVCDRRGPEEWWRVVSHQDDGAREMVTLSRVSDETDRRSIPCPDFYGDGGFFNVVEPRTFLTRRLEACLLRRLEAYPALEKERDALREELAKHEGCIAEMQADQLAVAERENELHHEKNLRLAALVETLREIAAFTSEPEAREHAQNALTKIGEKP